MIKTSANDILLFELCPYRWHLNKKGHKDKKQLLAFYRFSSALHEAMKQYVAEMNDPKEVFLNYWGRYKDEYPIIYRNNESWDSLKFLGIRFIEQFVEDFNNKFEIKHILSENKLNIITEDWEYIGQPDFVGYDYQRNCYVILDYKTTYEDVNKYWLRNSDQMTGFAMLIMHHLMINKFPIGIIICNFNATSESIKWLFSNRNLKDIEEYKKKISYIVEKMKLNYYPRSPGYTFKTPCSWCDVAEICFSNDENKGKTVNVDNKKFFNSLKNFKSITV